MPIVAVGLAIVALYYFGKFAIWIIGGFLDYAMYPIFAIFILSALFKK